MENKKTKRDYFNELLTIVDGNEELTAFIQHEIELLSKKKSSKKATANQVENETIKENIVSMLTSDGVTATEIMKNLDADYPNISIQRVTSLLSQLVKEDRIVKDKVKGKSLFSIPNKEVVIDAIPKRVITIDA